MDRDQERRLAFAGCGLAAILPPLGIDLGAALAFLWYLVHDTARMRGQRLSADDAWAVLAAVGPDLAWSLVGGSGIKWLAPPLGMGLGSYFNVVAARNAVTATNLFLDSGRRLRGNALRQELAESARSRRRTS